MNFQTVIDALTQIITDILNFIPNLINGLIILIVGIVIARIARWILRNVLRRIGFDPLVERTGITGSLRGLGVQTPMSAIAAQTIFLLLLISFLITATRLMGLEAVAQILERVLTFLPDLIAALIVFLLGGMAAQFTGNLVRNLAAAGNLSYANQLARLVQYVISVFVAILALGVLGLDTALLVTAVTIFIAAFGLALGLALGLGARQVVHHLLAGYYLRTRFPIGRTVLIDLPRGTTEGTIQGTSGVNTLVATTDREIIVPNGVLLEQIVETPRQTP
jgi:small-conductance mechanosensitive channel